MENEKKRSQFFKETFLLADINMNVVLKMSFLILSNVEIEFTSHHIYRTIYTIAKTLLIKKQIELIGKKKFVATAFDLDDEVFIIYVSSTSQNLNINLSQKA